MNYKIANYLSTVFFTMGVVTTLFLYLFDEVKFWFIFVAVLALLFVIAGIGIKVIFFRCPHCHGLLPYRTITIPTFCPGCGKKLN